MCKVTSVRGGHTKGRRTATSWMDVMIHDILLKIHRLKGFWSKGRESIPPAKSATTKLLFFMHLPHLSIHLCCQTGVFLKTLKASHVTPTVSFVEYALVIKAHGLLSCCFIFHLFFFFFLFVRCVLIGGTSCLFALVHIFRVRNSIIYQKVFVEEELKLMLR